MKEWGSYWREVCAPKLKRRKDEFGREMPEREIAAAVATATGKRSERQLVNLWLLGEREPYITQFFALCEKLKVEPLDVLEPEPPKRDKVPLAVVNDPVRAKSHVATGRQAKKSRS